MRFLTNNLFILTCICLSLSTLVHLIYTRLSAEYQHPTPVAAPRATPSTMSWYQTRFSLPPRSRGSYLVTDQVVAALPELKQYKVGLLNLFVLHTSCALSLNENWDSDVRADMSDAMDRIAPDSGAKGEELYRHNAEGPDDMPVWLW